MSEAGEFLKDVRQRMQLLVVPKAIGGILL